MKARWVKFFPVEFCTETDLLDPETLGVFTRLFMRACAGEGTIPDNDLTHYVTRLSARRWRRVRATLIAHGLLVEADGALRVPLALRFPWGRRAASKRERRAVMAMCDGACVACGATDDLAVDHIVAVANGGVDTIDNLQMLCRGCNSSKGARQ